MILFLRQIEAADIENAAAAGAGERLCGGESDQMKDERASIATNAKDAAIARPPGRQLICDFRVLRSIDMVLPFCCARCVAAKVRRVHKRAMKDDVKVKAKKHRAIQTGMGPVEVRRAKVRDRGDVVAEEKIRFTSSILPKWARRTRAAGELPAPTPTYFFNSPPREVTMHRRVFLATTVAAASAATLKAGPKPDEEAGPLVARLITITLLT